MGRLDEPAKKRIVELRRAGLSFRRIKTVLELDNIKVSAQTIYLFLKKNKKIKLEQEERGLGASPTQSGVAVRGSGWADQQLWSLMQDRSTAGYPRTTGQQGPSQARGQGSVQGTGPTGTPSGSGSPSTAGDSGGSSRKGVAQERKEEEIKIVSVTSLSETSGRLGFQKREGVSGAVNKGSFPLNPAPQRGPQATGSVPQLQGPSSGNALPANSISKAVLAATNRRRVLFTQPRNPTLIARKRLVEKAILHKMKVKETGSQNSQHMGQPSRRGQCYIESAPPNLPPGFSVSSGSFSSAVTVTGVQNSPLVYSTPQQRLQGSISSSVSRGPTVSTASPASMMRGASVQSSKGPGQAQSTQAQPSSNPSTDSSHLVKRTTALPASARANLTPCMDTSTGPCGGSAVLELLGNLNSQLRTLSNVVLLLTEQQGRLEREQAQQTQVQRQILSTLQGMATSLRPAPPSPAPCTESPAPGQAPYTPITTDPSHTKPVGAPSGYYNITDHASRQYEPISCSSTQPGHLQYKPLSLNATPHEHNHYQSSDSTSLSQICFPPVSMALSPPDHTHFSPTSPDPAPPPDPDTQFNIFKVELF
ncbi:uncharacterized protein LOC121301055 [Polyodon spathula]|uniref:uncharacterized protein LOC121301055 n=1 Tax=Polyodon spathula TaxID=7913 RepID=UPI001B7E6B3A|nr:uncharacterized protein LOC121301055 [Polyodon spathula]